MAQEFARKFYMSKAWRDFRVNLIIKNGAICQRCGRLVLDTSKLIGHHKITLTEFNITDPGVTLNENNVDLICFDCHNKEHRRYGHSQHNVYIVYGSPLSGKATLVNQIMGYGDLVLDIDKLYEAISGRPLYDKPENIRYNVFALRDKMLDMIKTRYGDWYDCYVIGGYPNKQERERLARELRAELVYVESTKEECRLKVANSGRSNEWCKFIDKWWKEYVE